MASRFIFNILLLMKPEQELSIIQKTYDLIQWYVPIINGLPRSHKFTLGDRLINNLYNLLEGLIKAKYAQKKLTQLLDLNVSLDIIRYQTRILQDFNLISLKKYEYVSEMINHIGIELGGWINNRKKIEK